MNAPTQFTGSSGTPARCDIPGPARDAYLAKIHASWRQFSRSSARSGFHVTAQERAEIFNPYGAR